MAALVVWQAGRTEEPPPDLGCPSCLSYGLEAEDWEWVEQAVTRWRAQLATPGAEGVEDPLRQVGDWIERHRDAGMTFNTTFYPSYKTDRGFVGQLTLSAKGNGTSDLFTMAEAFVEKTAKGRIWASPPASAYESTRTTRVQVTTRIDPSRRWMISEAFVELTTHGSPTAVFEFPTARANLEHTADLLPHDLTGYDRGADLTSVSQAGQTSRYQFDGQRLAVGLSSDRDPARLRFRYEGVPGDDHSHFRGNHAVLHSWFPVSVASRPAMELTLIVPASHQSSSPGAATCWGRSSTT